MTLCGLMVFILSLLTIHSAADTRVKGLVVDSVTSEPLSYVNVTSKITRKGVLTDANGYFSIPVASSGDSITISSLGYKTMHIPTWKGHNCNKIILIPETTDLSEIVIRPGRYKYSKKNNPAVDLMKSVKDDHKRLDPLHNEYFSYDMYEKTVLGLNDYNTYLGDRGGLKGKISFLEECVDTAEWTGKRILALSLREKAATRLVSRTPKADKEIVSGLRNTGIDEAFNQQNIQLVMEDVLRQINIYDNDIILMQNRFVSPLSSIAADFYMFHLGDTVNVDGLRCVELDFAPHNPESFGFNGTLFIADGPDSTRYVKRVSMRVPTDINLNYIKNLFISQNYTIDSNRFCVKQLDDLSLELQIITGTPVFYGRRQTIYNNFNLHKRNDLEKFYKKLGARFELSTDKSQEDEFWQTHRLVPLSHAETAMSGIMIKMRSIPLLYWGEKILSILEQGYIVTGKKSSIDFGPINTLVSHNTAEGFRFRIGAMTTANLDPHIFARGYIAYGLRDKKLKYMGEVEYSFAEKRYHSREFPVNSIMIRHTYDLDMLGQHYLFTNADNIFLSIKRKSSYLVTYRRLSEIDYRLELRNNFSLAAGFRHEIQEATQWVPFIDGDGHQSHRFIQSSFRLMLRYAPGETFSQGRNNRLPVNMDAPIIMLTHEIGPRKLFGASFTLNRTEISFYKRFWFSAFGYADMIIKGGKIWSQVQFPSLMWPNSNLSYTIQPESYSLMNPMEFAVDQYASIDLTYWMNGLIFNRIPLIKKLKMREVLTFKALTGCLTRKNNPAYNNNLYRFPYDSDTHMLGKKPYMELGVGLDNIFTVLRIDYIWRLTYRNFPGIDKSGIRISLHFSF